MIYNANLSTDTGFDLTSSGFQSIVLEDLQERVQRPYSYVPRPFLKWAGSKRFVLKHILEVLPKQFLTYREPFLGSGALFFFLRPERAVLSDRSRELIETFEVVRDNVSTLIRYLRPMKPSKRLFYEVRADRSNGRIKRASEFIYLNKTCWNGLYRVNASGAFNVPFGSPKSDSVADFDNLRECSSTLSSPKISIRCCDFEENLKGAKLGDLVYLDPPYVTGHNNNGFIEYNESIFSWEDQLRLAKIAKDLASKGAHVIVSNADHDELIRLYDGFEAKYINRTSTLASDTSKRRKVSEVILYSTSQVRLEKHTNG